MKDKRLRTEYEFISKKIFTYSFLGVYFISEFADNKLIDKIFLNAIPYELIKNNYEHNYSFQAKAIEIIGNVLSCNDVYTEVSNFFLYKYIY